MNRAIYKGKYRDKYGYAVHLFYEYKGYEYMVTDTHNGAHEPLWEQHRDEQRRIDREIAEKEKTAKTGILPESDSVKNAMNLLFSYWEG